MQNGDWLDGLGTSGDPQDPQRKRSSRACDECRKTKSKCNRDEGGVAPCSSCYAAGIPCTFHDPTFKRGPPKGYIQAIELRLRQVESVLGTILTSTDPRARSLIQDIRNDSLANDILDRVDGGPFGPSGRAEETQSILSHEAFLQAVTQPGMAAPSPTMKRTRVRRGTREDRENMSVDSDQEPRVPTLAWQDQLLSSLNPSTSPLPGGSTHDGVPSGRPHPISINQPSFALPSAYMSLSMEASGAPQTLLADIPTSTQLHLVDLYFGYVHPFLPAISKSSFYSKFNSTTRDPRSARIWSADPTEGAWVLLLLCVYTVASHYSDPRNLAMSAEIMGWRNNCYASSVKICREISPLPTLMTCQALLLLAYEEMGLGSLSQAWSLIGMAIRMAQDLYLHDTSKDSETYTPEQILERQRVWWTCIIMDRYISIDTARPSAIGVKMYNTPFPQDDQDEISEIWCQRMSGLSQVYLAPVACRPMPYFSAISSLCLISGSILDKMFALDADAVERRLKHLPRIENELDHWMAQLPPSLRLDESASILIPPEVAILHMHYWVAVLLLHRNLLPPSRREIHPSISDIERKAFGASQVAASRIVDAAAKYDANVTLKSCSPVMVSHLHMAGMMYIYSLSLQPSAQSETMLERIIHMLREIEPVWSNATKSRQILRDHLLRLEQPSAISRGLSPQTHTHRGSISRPQAPSRAPGPSSSYGSGSRRRN